MARCLFGVVTLCSRAVTEEKTNTKRKNKKKEGSSILRRCATFVYTFTAPLFLTVAQNEAEYPGGTHRLLVRPELTESTFLLTVPRACLVRRKTTIILFTPETRAPRSARWPKNLHARLGLHDTIAPRRKNVRASMYPKVRKSRTVRRSRDNFNYLLLACTCMCAGRKISKEFLKQRSRCFSWTYMQGRVGRAHIWSRDVHVGSFARAENESGR